MPRNFTWSQMPRSRAMRRASACWGPSPTSTSADLAERYRAVLPSFVHPYYTDPISIDRGDGSWVWDLVGDRYLDMFGGVLTTMVGHANPAATAAIREQAGKVLHTSSLYLSEPMLTLADRIAER